MRRFIKYALFAIVIVFSTSTMFAKAPKYVFYFIGDGMGLQQVIGTEIYLAQAAGESVGYKYLSFSPFEVNTYARNRSASSNVTDSSASGTALATGHKTNNEVMGLLPDKKTSVYSVAYYAKQAGFKVGITTSVGINHATPGAFYAHVEDRYMYGEIGRQAAESDFDFFGGGNFISDERPQINELAEKNGYSIARGVAGYKSVKDNAKRVMLFPEDPNAESLASALDKTATDLTLAQVTESAIDFLSKDNKKGFFLMVEGGNIDHGCHNTDAALTFHEVIDFSDAVAVAVEFAKQHPSETLIVVTADHETGSLGLGINAYRPNFGILKYQKVSRDRLSEKMMALREEKQNVTWDDMKAFLSENLGFWKEVRISFPQEIELMQTFQESFGSRRRGDSPEMVKTLYSLNTTLAAKAIDILNKNAEVAWGSSAHSGTVVPVFVEGVGAKEFLVPMLDNTDIPKIIKKVAGY